MRVKSYEIGGNETTSNKLTADFACTVYIEDLYQAFMARMLEEQLIAEVKKIVKCRCGVCLSCRV